MSESFKTKHRKKDSAFIRNRILSFVELVVIQINRLVLSLNVELENFLDLIDSNQSYSKQAFSKARQLFSHSAFIELNKIYIQGFYEEDSYLKYKDDYILLAVDGSLCQLPESKEVADYFIRWKNHLPTEGMPMARVSLLYDVLNQTVIDASISPNTFGEITLFKKHLKETTSFLEQLKTPIIFLMDRGYPSFELMQEIKNKENYFVIRCKASYRKEVIEFVNKNINEDELLLIEGKRKMNVRIVRILLSSNQYEYLLTNTDFDINELSDLYFKRWGIETFYEFLKNKLQLENFSSKTKEGIFQDFFVSILIANISSLLVNDAQKQLDQEVSEKRKYSQKVNKNIAIGIVRNNIAKLLMSDTGKTETIIARLITKIKRHTIDLKPDRSFVRRKLKRSKRKYHIAQKRGF
ncbi:IS4 family transposase [Flavobacterium sp. RS13.1]|uniref:IS4 family transposase n=1 Tax=Flavobacterium sp. RS13.1 TaxID=3400345 RepID=UPI003AADA891